MTVLDVRCSERHESDPITQLNILLYALWLKYYRCISFTQSMRGIISALALTTTPVLAIKGLPMLSTVFPVVLPRSHNGVSGSYTDGAPVL